MLITGQELMREEPDGTRVRHADLSSLSSYGWSEIVVDGTCWSVCLEQWIYEHRASKPIDRAFDRRLRTSSFDIHTELLLLSLLVIN